MQPTKGDQRTETMVVGCGAGRMGGGGGGRGEGGGMEGRGGEKADAGRGIEGWEEREPEEEGEGVESEVWGGEDGWGAERSFIAPGT